MSQNEKQSLFAGFSSRLILHAQEIGYMVTYGETYRTIEQQGLHFAHGLTKTLKSKHTDRLAIDLNFFKDGEYINALKSANEILKDIGDYWKSLNSECVWGGDWGWDAGHFQLGE